MKPKPVRAARAARRTRAPGVALALVVACGLPVLATAAGNVPMTKGDGGTVVTASGDAYWYDGKERRPLYTSQDQAADFGSATARKVNMKASSVLVPRSMISTKDTSDGVSPVFHDDSAGGSVRALPGGVIVTLKSAATEADARAALQALGVQPVRRIGAMTNVWLVASDPGQPSLDLANRLFEGGQVEAAQPNWWRPHGLK